VDKFLEKPIGNTRSGIALLYVFNDQIGLYQLAKIFDLAGGWVSNLLFFQ
jgi:hypothetical protein